MPALLNGGQGQVLDYAKARRRQADRNRAATKSSQDIFPIPGIEDWERRQRCGESLQAFCETYFPSAFHREWSPDHLRVISKIEKAVREGGLFAFAMPRGSGKTTLARCSALWAILYGYRPFVCLIGAADDRAKELLIPIKKHMVENPLLLADFPEAVYPLRALENSSKRQLQQHIAGQLTHVHWGQDKLVFPTVKLVYAFPSNEKLWDEYANVRQRQGQKAATEFYRRNRAAMDVGANVAWAARYDCKSEASAIQHAINLSSRSAPRRSPASTRTSRSWCRSMISS